MTTHKGGCHCGRVRFEVEVGDEFKEAIECNCSICSKKGSILAFVAREKLRLLTPETNMSTYTFNKHVIKHHFCKTCGIHPFGEAAGPQGPGAAVNLRCLEDFDMGPVKVTPFDGQNL